LQNGADLSLSATDGPAPDAMREESCTLITSSHSHNIPILLWMYLMELLFAFHATKLSMAEKLRRQPNSKNTALFASATLLVDLCFVAHARFDKCGNAVMTSGLAFFQLHPDTAAKPH
jgi:hypothetical protein